MIGRARTVLLFGRGDAARAVVSTVVARASRCRGRGLTFSGPAAFEAHAAEHLDAVVRSVVDRIVALLHLEPRRFDLSLVNLGAASAADVGLEVSGFSADAAAALAMLSAALRIPVPGDMVVTGHLASADGDIRPVKGIPAKLAAALADASIRRFIYPSLDTDASLAALSPAERERIITALAGAKERIRVLGVADLSELCRAVFSDEAIVRASLRSGFFDVADAASDETGPVGATARLLAEGNERRFWAALEARLLAGQCDDARSLLSALTRHHIRRERYPEGFGRKLLGLVRSLPPATRRLKTGFPLVTMGERIELARFAGPGDHEDVQDLFDAAAGKATVLRHRPPVDEEPVTDEVRDADAAVEIVLEEISAEALAAKIGLPIDAARAAYTMEDVTVDSHDAFHDTTAAFYLSLLRHTGAHVPAGAGMSAAESFALVERAFADKGGADAALAEARHGTNGGMRFVLDVLTERFKTEEQSKHVSRVIKEAIDPLDWNARVAFMAALLARIGPQLPPEIRSEPPERFARHYETIVRTYVWSLDRVKRLLRTL